jgi:protease-4
VRELRRNERLQLIAFGAYDVFDWGVGDVGERGVLPIDPPGQPDVVGRLRAPAHERLEEVSDNVRCLRPSRGLRVPRRLACLALLLVLPGCVTVQLGGGTREPLVETVILGDSGPKIVLIDIDGVISESGEDRDLFGPPEESTVARVREQLERARDDKSVRALLLRINSPGGTVTASDIVYQEVLRFKRERGLPVIAHFLGLAASGGYYVAMAADEVIAQPTSVTGSIGVIFVGLNVTQLMGKLGIADQTLTAGEQKDSGSWLRPMKPAEREHLQAILDDMHARFKHVVAQGRPQLDAARIDALADGRIYSADQALASGLVDRHGDLEEAVAAAERRAGITSSRVVIYHRPREYRQNVYTQAPAIPRAIRLELAPSLPLPRPGFLYLWAPGALAR